MANKRKRRLNSDWRVGWLRYSREAGWAALLVFLLSPFEGAARAADPELEIRVIYDNTSALLDVPEDWGFAAVVTFRGRRALFDSGTKPSLFLENLAKLRISPSSIEAAMISHQHPDHRNGIYALYPRNPKITVYFLDAFYDKAYQEAAAVGLAPRRITQPFELIPGAYSTGMIEAEPPEQSLAVDTSKGVVLLVGCSHPGLVKIVETVQRQRGADSIRLALGGFHMFQQDAARIKQQIEQLWNLNVQKVMPGHCSGELAKQLFREAYGNASKRSERERFSPSTSLFSIRSGRNPNLA